MILIHSLNKYSTRIAIILAGLMMFEVLSPSVALALTAGPTSPEASSFEPVDTTDMVNPLTGSFTYNLPLLEVPGPEGGYPLSLSYHAGIRPDLEASWVGLGWTLNPGAINRNVSGFPDDFSEVSLKRRDYWAGGNRKDYGLEVGFASVVNVGLVFASDTYSGFGIGASVGFGYRLGPIGAGVDVGLSPYSGSYAGMNVSSGIAVGESLNIGPSLSLSTNFESVNVGGGLSLMTNSRHLLSASINSSSNKPSLAVMGGSASLYNKNAGRISTSSSGFGFTIPLGAFSVGASFRSTRYWIDETAEVTSSGTLYTPIFNTNPDSQGPGPKYMDNRTYDNYRLLPDNLNIADNNDDEKLVGGTFPEYDGYSVTGQGIGGQIKPFLFQRALSLQNMYEYKSLSRPYAEQSNFRENVGFRFVNDFSNSFDQNLTNVAEQGGVEPSIPTMPFDMAGKPDNRIGNELAGSKHVKYFTNDEIRGGTAKSKGFIDVGNTAKGFQRITNGSYITSTATKGGSQIGGFMITNESGVTYHYALPAYSYNEYSFNSTNKGGYKYTETKRNEPYAYTWLLTAVTGPDYVDRNNNGLVDEADWGYWVAMDYGKWTGNYIWRTPAQGTDPDLDRNYFMYTSGQKELYYVNKIRTRTHTAIFEKEVRLDGKGAASNALTNRYIAGGFDATSMQSLRLNRVYLLKNSDAGMISETSEYVTSDRSNELYGNVIDNYDVSKVGRNNLESKAIRVIDFGYSYDLSKKTPNSFRVQNPDVKFGKLTLDGVHFRGKGGADLLPVTKFSYASNQETFEAENYSANQFVSNAILDRGMMIESAGDNPIYYGMITDVKIKGGGGYIYTLSNGENITATSGKVNLRITKNPDYCQDCQDIWGFYKGDIDRSLLTWNQDLARRVTATSSVGTDAWNLRAISSPLGSNIELNYESNEYAASVFERKLSIPLRNYQRIDNYKCKVEIPVSKEEFEKSYPPGSVIDGVFMLSNPFPLYLFESNTSNQTCFYEGWTDDNKIILRFNREILGLNLINIRFNLNANMNYGGGARIKSIRNKTVNNTIYQTDYHYGIDNTSWGVTSYVPYNIETGDFADNVNEAARILYKRALNKDLDNVLKYAREIPGPGVMYRKVQIRNKVIHPNGDSQKEGFAENTYRVLDRRMISREIIQDHYYGKYKNHGVNLSIADFTANIGDLLGVKYYDAEGKLIQEISNKYLMDEVSSNTNFKSGYKSELAKFNYQGLVTERFGEARFFYKSNERNVMYIIMGAKEQYPSIMLSSTRKDYVNGSSETTKNLGFDFINGLPSKILNSDSYGNQFITESEYAYQQYPEMANKVISMSNKNMLSQIFSKINYKVDAYQNKIGVINGVKTTWSKNVNVLAPTGEIIKQNNNTYGHVWRKEQESIIEIPDQYSGTGMLPIQQFNMNAPFWKMISTLNLYNVYSKPLEDYDRNYNYSVNRYGYNNSKIVAGANYSKYKELAYSGVEDELVSSGIPGEVSGGAGTVSSGVYHTGHKSLFVAAGSRGFEYSAPIDALTPGRSYIASVWVKNSPASNVKLYYEIDNVVKAASVSSGQSNKKSGDWTLVHIDIPLTPGTNFKIYANNEGPESCFMDDFRFHPKNTSAKAYVYDTFSGELTYVLDHLNLFTRFEYDAMGRLIRTYKEQLGKAPYKTNEYQQNYGINKAVFYNDKMEESVQKNNCSWPGIGGKVVYTVPQGKYSSSISKADANSKALAEINTLGQEYANANANCITCRKYKVTIHRMNLQNLNLYVNYRDCNNQYRSSSYQNFESEGNSGSYLVFYVCTYVSNSSISFSHGQNQPAIDLSAEIELVGDCY
ncbi:DUF5977 domain-containing protein [Sphingobacterium spiritivorum]|uniref:DUF5977 domain-containing protein n=1 Tax=Sphingobacterium spiritivorum TaxID=258 RepID=UPI0036C1C248